MIRVAIETSTWQGSVAVGRDGEVLAEVELGARSRHASTAVPGLQEAVETANRAFQQVEAAIAEGELTNIVDNIETMTAKMDSVSEALTYVSRDLGSAVAAADSSFGSLNTIMGSLERGEGSLGALLQDTALYNELVLTSTLVQDLLLDFQRNPRKYINLRVF